MKTLLLAAATTLAIATGAMALSSETASAQSYSGQHHNQNGNWNNGPRPNHGPGWNNNRGHKVCKPVVRNRQVHGRHGWYWKKVVIGQKCFWVHGSRW
jgi:hypothetical protein